MELAPVIETDELSTSNHVSIITVDGMTGASSAELIERTLRELEGVSRVKVRTLRLSLLCARGA